MIYFGTKGTTTQTPLVPCQNSKIPQFVIPSFLCHFIIQFVIMEKYQNELGMIYFGTKGSITLDPPSVPCQNNILRHSSVIPG